jgi:RNA polymerase sigma factor (TIGR02999 family)
MPQPGFDGTTQDSEIIPGDASASLDVLFPRVYAELRDLAGSFMRRERGDHTLVPTALVHEVYMRLTAQDVAAADRPRFFGIAAEMMRRVLVNHAVARRAAKRGGGQLCVTLDENNAGEATGPTVDVIALNDALVRLAVLDPRAAQIVDLRFFAGLDVPETALVLGVSRATVKREWSAARAWLRREVGND